MAESTGLLSRRTRKGTAGSNPALSANLTRECLPTGGATPLGMDDPPAGMRGLEPEATDREVALYHASPRDPVWEYVLWPDQAAECIAHQASRVSFVVFRRMASGMPT